MDFNIKFKGLDHSEALIEYVHERFARIHKYEIRPSHIHVTFHNSRHHKMAEVFIQGINNQFRAKGDGDTYHGAVDQCLKKIERQMEKEKSKIKKHRHWERTAEAKLEELLVEERKIKEAA